MNISANQPFLGKNHLIFLMCCDMRNFSKVAQALEMTQSAVSKSIMALEKEVGFPLFIRNSRPMTLTPEAKLLQQYLSQVNGEYRNLMDSIRSRSFLRPILRIGILESLSLSMGVEIVRRMIPELSQVTIITASANVLKQRLEERKLDLIITNDISSGDKSFFRKKLFKEPSVFLLPQRIASSNSSWSWENIALCGLPMISYWRETGAGQINDMFLKMHGLDFTERIVVDTNAIMVKLVAEGIGWAFTRPTTVLENIHMLSKLVVAEIKSPVLLREVFLMGREGEFTQEEEHVARICRSVLLHSIIPEIQRFAPWTVSDMKPLEN